MDFGTWLDLREEFMMLVISGSYSLLLSLMSQVGIGSSMQLFAGDLPIIFHTSSSVVFRRKFRVETGGDCAISRLMSEQSGRLSLILSIFSLKKHKNLFASSSAELCSGSFETFCLKRSSFIVWDIAFESCPQSIIL